MLVQGKIRYRKIIGICLVSFLVAGQARSSTTLISAATVIDNLTATVFEDTTAAENDNQADDDHGPLKFNITWRAPLDDSRKPSSYSSDGSMWVPTERSRICSRHFVGNEKSENPQSPSYHPSIFPSVYKKQTVSTQSASDRVLITSVRKNDDDDDDRGENLCPDDETLFYTTWDGNRCHAVLPENKFFSDAPELTIRPTCSYDIQVFANPRSNLQLEAPKIVLTVPKCVGRWCSCEDAQRYLPIPKVDIVTSNNRRRRRREITITWKSTIHPESRVHSYVIRFGVPFLVSNNRLAVYNLTKIAIVTSTVSSYRWFIDNSTDFDITAGGKVSVTAQDNRGCFGTPGYALVDPLVASLDASVDRPVHWHVWTFLGLGLSSMTILGGIISFLYARNKKAYKPIWTNDQRTQGLMGLSRLRSQQKLADSTLRERNVLYVEQQVQHDATDRGECGECGECTDAAAAAAEDQFQVSHERLKFIRELGEGQFGKVYLGRLENEHGYRRDSVLVAIKISNCPADRGSTETSISQARQQFLAEIETMKNVGAHPHLVRLIATCTLPVENNPICLILEYLEGGDLLAHLHRIRDSLECYRGRYCCRTAAGDQAAAAAAAEQQLMVPFDSGVPHVSSSRIQQTHHQSLCKTIYTTLPSAPDNRSPATMAKFPDFSATDTLKCIDDTPAASEEYAGRVYMNSGDEENSSDYDLDGGRFISFASDIARGMRHLESRGIIHRDLAARNILLSSDMTLKISDFGLARNDRVYVIAGGSGEDGVRRLPVRWMAPEALRDRAFTSKSDVWSFAIVLWEIGTLGAFPYFDIQDDRVVRYVLHDGGRLRRPSGISPLLYDTIMLSCWASRPENRPSFVEIVERLSTLGEPSKIFNATSNPC